MKKHKMKTLSDVVYLREHPEVIEPSNLVLLSSRGRILLEAPIPGSNKFSNISPGFTRIDQNTFTLILQTGIIHWFNVKKRAFTRTVKISPVKKFIVSMAMAPGGHMWIADSRNNIYKYDSRGKLIDEWTLASFRSIRRIWTARGNRLAVFGKLKGKYDYKGITVGKDLVRRGMPVGVVSVTFRGRTPVEKLIFKFADQAAVTGRGLWVYVKDLVPGKMDRMSHGKRGAHDRSDYLQQRLLLFNWNGKIVKSYNVTNRSCGLTKVIRMDAVGNRFLMLPEITDFKRCADLFILAPKK